MKKMYLLSHRLLRYFEKNKVIFILFLVGGILSSLTLTYMYENFMPSIANSNSQEIYYREYTVSDSGIGKINEGFSGYDFYALKNVSLTVNDGEFVSVCGASGSGKTTLLNVIGCLDTYDGGTYRLDGVDISKSGDKKRAQIRNSKIGFVLQDFALINSQKVLYNVMLPLMFGKCPYGEVKSKALDALGALGVADQAEKRANQLSGGQRQRVAIARAIVNSPSIVLADEPTGQLDSKTGAQTMELLSELNRRGITVIVVTHDAKVASMAGRIITVSDGEIVG